MKIFFGVFVLFFGAINCFAECEKLDSHALESFAGARVKEKRYREGAFENYSKDGSESDFFIAYDVISWSAGFNEGLAKIVVDGKSGFINLNGSIAIQPQFTMASCFSDGLAAVEINGKWGFINHSGDLVIPAKFDAVANYAENLALVNVGELWGFIDKTGRFVIEPKFEQAKSFSEGFAVTYHYDENYEWVQHSAVKRKGRWRHNFIDKQGKIKFQAGYDGISRNFNGGMAIVDRQVDCPDGYCSESYVIDKNGVELWILNTWYISWFRDDLIEVAISHDEKTKYNKYSFLDRNGKRITNKDFDHLYGFSEGLAAARIENKYGFINKTGKFVIKPQFSGGGTFSEGLAAVEKAGETGFINRQGKWIFKLKYDWTSDFHEGRAAVAVGDSLGYIDKTGKYIWKLSK